MRRAQNDLQCGNNHRPRKVWQRTVTFKAPDDVREQIAEMAAATGMSRGGVIKAAITAHYDQLYASGLS